VHDVKDRGRYRPCESCDLHKIGNMVEIGEISVKLSKIGTFT